MQASEKLGPSDPVTDWHVHGEAERQLVREGGALRRAAQSLAARVPLNALILTRNEESAALVGAALALNAEAAKTCSWRPYHPGRLEVLEHQGPIFLVDAGPIGEGLAHTMVERIPGLEILASLATERKPERLRRVA